MPRYLTVCNCCNYYFTFRYRQIWNPILPQ